MGVRAINLKRTFDFVWEKDEDFEKPNKEGCAVWKFRALDSYQVAYLNDQMMAFEQLQGDPNAKVHMGKVALMAFRMSLVEVQNFNDEEGDQPLEIKLSPASISGRSYNIVREDFMRKLPPALITDAYTAISEFNGMSAEKAKKSA